MRQPDPVENHEPVARFLTSKGHFSSQNARVKKGAFLPDKARETSVYRTEGMTLEDVWALGNRRITIWPKYRKFYGVGEITRAAVVIVKPVGLDVKPDRGPDGHTRRHPAHFDDGIGQQGFRGGLEGSAVSGNIEEINPGSLHAGDAANLVVLESGQRGFPEGVRMIGTRQDVGAPDHLERVIGEPEKSGILTRRQR